MRCDVCGKEKELFDVVSDKGILRVCENCAVGESLPIIRKPGSFEFKGAEKRPTVYERLSRATGYERREPPKKAPREDENLRKIVEKNFEAKPKVTKPDELIENFHWIVMRARRSKKLTQKELAEKIGEPEIAVKHLEQGVLPTNYYGLINKVENALGLNLFKEKMIFESSREIPFDRKNKEFVTIEDLKRKQMSSMQGSDIEFSDADLEYAYEKMGDGDDIMVEGEPEKKKGFFGRLFG